MDKAKFLGPDSALWQSVGSSSHGSTACACTEEPGWHLPFLLWLLTSSTFPPCPSCQRLWGLCCCGSDGGSLQEKGIPAEPCARQTHRSGGTEPIQGHRGLWGLKTELPRAAPCTLPGLAQGLGREFQPWSSSSHLAFHWESRECRQHLTLQGSPHPYTGKIQTESKPGATCNGFGTWQDGAQQPPPHGSSSSGQAELGKAP